MKLRTKLFLAIFLTTAVSLVVTFLVAGFLNKKTLTNTIGGYNVLLAKNSIGSVDSIINRRLELLESYSENNSELNKALSASNDKFDAMPAREEQIEIRDDLWKKTAEGEITPFMRGILENPLSDSMRLQTKFYEKKHNYNIFPEFFVTNKYGALVASTNKTTDYWQSDEEWWQKARAHKLWISDILYDQSSGVYSLEFCVRVDDENDKFLGVAKAVYNIRDIFSVLDEIVEPLTAEDQIVENGFGRKTVNARLVTADGRLIYSTKGGFGNLEDESALLAELKVFGNKNNSFSIIDDKGVKELYSYAHSEGYLDFKTLGWVLIIDKEVDEALSPLHKINDSLLLLIVLAIGFVLILVFVLSRSLTKKINKLSAEMKKIESDNWNVQVEVNGDDEVGQLTRSFAGMIATLKEFRENVDKKVAEQTKVINQKVLDSAEKQKALLNVLEDVDAEKNNLALAKAQDEAILSGIGDGVFVLDLDWRIVLFNPTAEKISGFSAAEVIGKKYADVLKFVYEKDGKINDDFIREAIEKGVVKQMANHTSLIQKDGGKVSVADSAAPIKDVQGKIFGCVVVFRDVTIEREIDKMKTEFVSVASHQLRTPLTGIKWFAELLLKTKLNNVAKDYVHEIAVSNERMVHLVDDLLNVSRIETGRKFDVILRDVDVVAIMKGVIEELIPVANKKHISLICSTMAPSKLILAADELKIHQVFQNLISNSIKYSKENTRVEVGCDQSKDEVVFIIKDEGVGIPKHQQNQIFTKFFRAENIMTMHTDGTGLGLYIVKAIVEAHGGRVWFDSEENNGTTFYVSLPKKSVK